MQTAEGAVEAAAFKTVLPRMELQDGDTVVFLGDSTTHQCLYTQSTDGRRIASPAALGQNVNIGNALGEH